MVQGLALTWRAACVVARVSVSVKSKGVVTVVAKKEKIRRMAALAQAEGWPVDWFDQVYEEAGGDPASIPWADLAPNPNLQSWLAAQSEFEGRGRRALVVGCGLGDDAEALAALGFEVTAFDISRTAIDWCHRRSPESSVSYQVADVLAPPEDWRGAFDFIFEAYTLQVLPEALAHQALRRLTSLLAPGGQLLLIARGRDDDAPRGQLPWPLSRAELAPILAQRCDTLTWEDYLDPLEASEVRRFRILARRRPQAVSA